MPGTSKTNRCRTHVTDKVNKRKRLCKNKVHSTDNCFVHSNKSLSENKCCFCGVPCKFESQSCGSCARTASWYGMDYLHRKIGMITECGF